MALIIRYRFTWNYGIGSPGVSTFYTTTGLAQPFVDALRTFLNTCMGNGALGCGPSTLTITGDSTADKIEDTNGHLDSTIGVTKPADVVGGNGPTFAAPAGAVVNWLTNGVVVGIHGRPRKVRGKTFLVPMSTSEYDNAGNLTSGALTALNSASNTLIGTTAGLAVWHRPTAPGATDGIAFPVLGIKVNDKVAMLTSRRD